MENRFVVVLAENPFVVVLVRDMWSICCEYSFIVDSLCWKFFDLFVLYKNLIFIFTCMRNIPILLRQMKFKNLFKWQILNLRPEFEFRMIWFYEHSLYRRILLLLPWLLNSQVRTTSLKTINCLFTFIIIIIFYLLFQL